METGISTLGGMKVALGMGMLLAGELCHLWQDGMEISVNTY